MARATPRIYFGIRNPLHAAILLLQVLSLVSLVQCYRGDVSRGSQLVRGLVAVAREENPSTFSRRRKRRGAGTGEGIALKVEGRSAPIECKAGLLCPANSSCMTKGELGYCCEKGKLCPEPVDCLSLGDSQCDNQPGQLITDLRDGKVKNCCYAGYEICATFLDFPRCMPVTRTSLLASDTAQALTIRANSTSDSSGAGSGTLIGGLVGGAIGLVIVGICISYTASYYRQKLIEEKEAGLNMWEDNESGVMGIRGGRRSGPSSSSGSSSSRQSTGSWESSYPVSSSWSKSTLSDIHPGLEKDKEIAVMELENMSSSRGRFYTKDSRVGSKMPLLDAPLATATYHGVSQPFDWRSCQRLYPQLTSAAPQAQEEPPERKPRLPWLPLDLMIPTSSPIIGPWLESRRSTVAFEHRMSQRMSQRLSQILSFRLDMPSMPPTPRLEGRVPTRMSGALSSSSDGLDSPSPLIQKPPNALLASPMPMI